MKKIIYSALLLLAAGNLCAQNPIIFQPGPGLNDSTDQGGINGGKDSWGYEGNPTTIYGGDPIAYALPISNCNQTHGVAFFQFDLSGLPAAVDSVFVGIKHQDHTSYCYSNCQADFYFAYLMGPWYENTINYSNFPAQGADFFGPVTISFPNSFGIREYNITTAYNAWKTGAVPNNGFIVYSPTIGCNNAAVGFYAASSDDTALSARPYLKIYASSSGLGEKGAAVRTEIFPNPAAGRFTVKSSEAIAQLYIFDPFGRTILAMQPGASSVEIGTSGMAPGVYSVRMETATGRTIQKLVVQ